MFRGSARAKLDEKGRLKLPAAYLTPLLERFGAQLFITSMDGLSAQVYPLPVWLELEAKLAAPSGLLDPDLERFRMTVNYWGREVELDAQGRVVIHSPLREAAGLDGDCVVMGDPSGFLTLISQANAEAQVVAKPLTRKERARVAEKLRGGTAEKSANKPADPSAGRQP
jgi:MraZ protein